MRTFSSLLVVNQCQPFEPHEPHVIFVEYDMYLRLLYFLNLWKKFQMGARLLEFGGIRLVINQSVVPVELESSPKHRSCLSIVCYLRLYSLY